MKQHTIPRFYLEGFIDPEATGPDPYVWVYDVVKHVWRKRSPKKILAQSGYYDLPSRDGVVSHKLERVLSTIESKTAQVMRRLSNSGTTLSPEDRSLLALFVAHMQFRLPSMHNEINRCLTDDAERIMAMMYHRFKDDPVGWERYKSRQRDETGLDLSDMRLDDLDPSHYRVKAGHPAVLEVAFGPIEDIAGILSSMSWTFLITGGADYFVTSDSPFRMVNPTSTSQRMGHGLAYKDIEVTLPLNRNLALLIHHGEQPLRWMPARTITVAEINRRVCVYAAQLVVAPSKTFPGSKELRLSVVEQ